MKVSRKILIIGGSSLAVLAVTAAVVWTYGRPLYRAHKEKRAMNFAREFMAKKDYRNASLSARQALICNPANLEACQIMASLAEMVNSKQLVDWRTRIVELAPTVDNRLLLASTAVRMLPPPHMLASQILQQVAPEASNGVPFQLISAEMAVRRNDPEAAKRFFKRALEIQPDNHGVLLNIGALQLQSADPRESALGRETLMRLRSDSASGAFALRWLVGDALKNTNSALAEEFSRELTKHPMFTFDDVLQRLALLESSKRPELDDELTRAMGLAGTNAVQTYALTAWMVGLGRASSALKWLASLPPKCKEDQPVAFAYVECYTKLKDWKALESFLGEQRWPEAEFMRLAFLSRAAWEQKQPVAAETRWRSALSESGDKLGALTTLLGLVSSWGREPLKEELLWRIFQRYPEQRWTLQELNALYTASASTRGLNKLFNAVASFEKTNTSVLVNIAATSLLLKENLTKAHEIARRAYSIAPTNPHAISAYAFSLYHQGRIQEALGVMERANPEVLTNQPVALYYGIVLAASGDREKASKFFAVADKAQLLPEEKQLLADARRSQ